MTIGLVAQRVRDGHERDGDLDRAHDDQPRPARERLDEPGASSHLHGSGVATFQGIGRERGQLLVRRQHRRSCPPGPRPPPGPAGSAGGSPSPGVCGPNAGPGESTGSGVMTATPGFAGRRPDHVLDQRLHQHIDRAATREPDIPRLLVADAVADDPRPAGGPRPFHLLVRGALDAAAADRSGQTPVAAHEHRRTLRPWRRAEGAHDHGTRGRRRLSSAQAASSAARSFIGAWSRSGHPRRRQAPRPAAPGCPGHGTAGTRRCAARPPPSPPRAACTRPRLPTG